jgi:hypothetical protein
VLGRFDGLCAERLAPYRAARERSAFAGDCKDILVSGSTDQVIQGQPGRFLKPGEETSLEEP